uniref:NADH dehydrogenase subunit 4L n=1 Tax=Conlopa bredoni TaxID=3112144 RepID=UPI002E77E31A|nr:NADH dehydrogenase subunit 4L [Conlopa bredoni]WRK21436.1 NADH dehydrogenase subunit 4L [Conlopa bredoni]
MNYFFFFLIFLSLVSLIMVRKHLFICLLVLEFFVLYILFIIVFFLMNFDNCFYLYVFFMVFYVCEGALGLSLLVYVVRFHGNDYLNSMLMW